MSDDDAYIWAQCPDCHGVWYTFDMPGLETIVQVCLFCGFRGENLHYQAKGEKE